MEHRKIDQDYFSLRIEDEEGTVRLPVAEITCLLLGPGTSITHAAIKTATESGCLIVWCGENGFKFYASGMGETRSAKNLLLQAKL